MGQQKTKRQLAFFVEKSNERKLGYWIEYEHKGKTRSQIVVLKTVPALFPPSKIALGYEREAYDVPFDEIRTWLEDQGYQITSTMTA